MAETNRDRDGFSKVRWPIGVAFLFAFAFDLSIIGPLLGWEWITEVFAPLCHQRNERCLHFGDAVMAICSRCAGIYAGVVFGCLRVYLGRRAFAYASGLALAALLFNGADFFAEKMEFYGSHLWIRLFLGLSLGWMLVEFVRKREDAARYSCL